VVDPSPGDRWPMSIHLAGGGWSDDLFRPFLLEAATRAAGAGRVVPRIGVLLVVEAGTDGAAKSADYVTMLTGLAASDPVITVVEEGSLASSSLLTGIDGLLVGGGLTPAYLVAVAPIVEEVRLLVADGLPYLGFSAGASIAAESALIGGWLIGGVPVVSEDASEDLDEVTVAAGLALVDLTIDVHAAQWGNLARLIAATEAGLADGGVAIDENTVLIVGDGELRVEGIGSVWRVTPSDDGVLVSTLGAEEA
jgi:cyanophycinase